MKRICRPDVQKRALPTGLMGIFSYSSIQRKRTLHEMAFSCALPEIARLAILARDEKTFLQNIRNLSSPVTLEHLEMLEAELCNQGILPQHKNYSGSLRQSAMYESNLWRWKALRFGVKKNFSAIKIVIPAFLLYRAELLLRQIRSLLPEEHLTDSSPSTMTEISNYEAELIYLEHFAAYILGRHDKTFNRYQQGLKLVLDVIAKDDSNEVTNLPTLVLPISRERFISQMQ